MKKNYKFTWTLGLSLVMSTVAFSQAINEGFDDVTTLPGSGWAQQNLSTTQGTNPTWGQGGTPFIANSGAATAYVAANYNAVTGTGTISNWLFAPNRTFNNGDVISFFARAADAGYPDRLQVLFSANGASVNAGATDVSVGDFTTLLIDINPTLIGGVFTNAWVQYSYTFTGLGAPTSGRIAFRYFVTNGGPTGTNSDYIGVDDFVYTPFGAPTVPDVTVTNPTMNEYPMVPINQVFPFSLSATMNNVGTAATADATLTVNVFQAPNLVTPVYTETSPLTSITNGSSSVINFSSFTPTAIADYVVEYISACTNNTISAADTNDYIFQITDSIFARDNANITGIITGSLGIGDGVGGYIGQDFTISASDTLTAVDAFITNNSGVMAGLPFSVDIYNTDVLGTPTTLIASTDVITIDTTTNKMWTLPIAGGLALAPGEYAVLAKELTANITLGTTTGIFSAGKTWVIFGANPWDNSENYGFSVAYVLRPIFGGNTSVGIDEPAATSFSIYPNPTTETILVNNLINGSTLEIVNALGQVVYTETVTNIKSNINVANFNNGVYMIRINNGKEVITNTFVKQ